MMNRTAAISTLVLLAVAVPVGTFLATAGVMMVPPDTKGMDIVEGRDLFRAHCGSCHFATAGFPAHHGPNLHEIGRTGALRRPDMSSAAYILESILEPNAFVAPSSRPGMPKNVAAQLAPDKLRNIVAFLASRGAFPDYDEIAALEIPDRRPKNNSTVTVQRERMDHAVELMETKATCFSCHSRHTTPEATVMAPSIFHVGLKDRSSVRESIVEPHREIKAGYGSVSVVLQSGRIVSGRLLSRDDQRLVLAVQKEPAGIDVREIPLSEIDQEDGELFIEDSGQSAMPTDLGKLLSEEELESIITLIQQLN